jgi:Ca2+-binding EF-hand superfamily protein
MSRMRYVYHLGLVLCAALASTAVYARSHDPAQRAANMEKLRAKFATADANHDGSLSRDEASSGMPRMAKHFDEADADRDGKLSMTEVTAYIAKARAARSN